MSLVHLYTLGNYQVYMISFFIVVICAKELFLYEFQDDVMLIGVTNIEAYKFN